jgi:ubiquinone/menaquinone biosynthesis C-methylase UbiE
MNEFDEKAATWDDDPVRVERASAIADNMRKLLDLRAYRSALEYGSGTGLLSFALKDELEKITLMDESEGMTEVAIEKCKVQGVNHLHPIQADLVKSEYIPKEKFDLIFILLTLHHVEDISTLLSKFSRLMTKRGDLVIIDLEKEDGSFHDGEFHGHLGFDRAELEARLITAGFDPYHYEVCYEIEKEEEGGEKRSYPLFMMLARTLS